MTTTYSALGCTTTATAAATTSTTSNAAWAGGWVFGVLLLEGVEGLGEVDNDGALVASSLVELLDGGLCAVGGLECEEAVAHRSVSAADPADDDGGLAAERGKRGDWGNGEMGNEG
jgi:hypothetical protein